MRPKSRTDLVRIITLVGFSCLACVAESTPSCTLYLHEIQPDSMYAFAQANVIALAHAREAWQETTAFQAEQKPDDSPQTVMIAMMQHTKAASNAYACAQMVLEPYKKSHDEKMIAFTADFEIAIYKQHGFLNETLSRGQYTQIPLPWDEMHLKPGSRRTGLHGMPLRRVVRSARPARSRPSPAAARCCAGRAGRPGASRS